MKSMGGSNPPCGPERYFSDAFGENQRKSKTFRGFSWELPLTTNQTILYK